MEAALKAVWRSYFRLAALMGRLSAGMLTDGRRMCCMVQPMVDAKAAGVAFSSDPVTGDGAVLEFVGGLGDKLVSGDMTGTRLTPGEAPGPDAGAMTAQAAARVFQAVEALRGHFGFEVDIEWVWDGADLTRRAGASRDCGGQRRRGARGSDRRPGVAALRRNRR